MRKKKQTIEPNATNKQTNKQKLPEERKRKKKEKVRKKQTYERKKEKHGENGMNDFLKILN